MYTTPIKGQKMVLFFQGMEDDTSDGNQLRLAFQTEHTLTKERELMEEMTKDGMIKETNDQINASVDLTAFVAKGDATYELLEQAFDENNLLQVWEVDVTEEASAGTYSATYMQGQLENFEVSAGSEDFAELSTTFQVNLSPQKGEVTLTPEQYSAIQYAFQDFGELATTDTQ